MTCLTGLVFIFLLDGSADAWFSIVNRVERFKVFASSLFRRGSCPAKDENLGHRFYPDKYQTVSWYVKGRIAKESSNYAL